MKGAGVTMSSILNWPYWVGIAVVGSVITFNVVTGGMKGITLVQAFQYWAKLFAISVPLFVVAAVLGVDGASPTATAPGGLPSLSQPSKVKVKGAEAAPANVMAFPPSARHFTVPDGGSNWKVSTARKPEPGEDKIDPAKLVVRAAKTLDGQVWISVPQIVTKGGLQRFKGGKLVKTGAKIEFNKPTEVILTAGPTPNAPPDSKWQNPFGPLAGKWGFPLLTTYSLIIALVCGTAGLPHILVRFYTNPDGRAAKRTTLWVMVMLGAFYIFTPVWGTLGRSFMPLLYANNSTDSAVIKLPTIIGDPVLGQILSGVTSAGAFAAFMSTFSGLLVSMSSAFAHDIYGNILRPQATDEQRRRAFKLAAVGVGVISMGLGLLVETFDIATMVGWAFAIGAASYFPLLLLGSWWRGLTHVGAAAGMLLGGLLSLSAIVCNMLLDKKILTWTLPPLARALMEQPAIWGVPLSLLTMALVSAATKHLVPKDIGLKMLRLHAPEELGYSKNYIEG